MIIIKTVDGLVVVVVEVVEDFSERSQLKIFLRLNFHSMPRRISHHLKAHLQLVFGCVFFINIYLFFFFHFLVTVSVIVVGCWCCWCGCCCCISLEETTKRKRKLEYNAAEYY